MQNFALKDLILLASGFVLSISAALIGAYVQRKIDRLNERRPLNQILNFGNDSLLFIFPHREDIAESILPRTSTEDFLAMNNFISALLAAGWSKNVGVRDTRRVSSDDRKRNLVVICSPKSNTFAELLQERLKQDHIPIFEFAKLDAPEWTHDVPEWTIDNGDGQLKSPSFKQEADYTAQGIPKYKFSEQLFEDLAVVTKVNNPWNPKNKVIWLAGIRGIGTWAAGECIKKRWQDIYDSLPHNQKDSDFTALLRIRYANSDITKIEVRQVRVL